jgi:hypothetical protein
MKWRYSPAIFLPEIPLRLRSQPQIGIALGEARNSRGLSQTLPLRAGSVQAEKTLLKEISRLLAEAQRISGLPPKMGHKPEQP